MLNRLRNKVVVSVQAMPVEPLYTENCMIAMMKSVVKGGAGGLRVAGARDVKNAKALFDIPVMGLIKPNIIPANWHEIVYITPTVKDVLELVNAGADIIAFDGTSRDREGCTLEEIIKYVKINKRISMADVSTVEEGLNCANLGANILSTTLSGYTQYSPLKSEGPDFELLEELVKRTDVPVVLEGRIWEPEEVDRAFELGAHCVVIGSAITRPQLITKRFINRAARQT
ncbi:MAG: N-acetylmannosamine-6-phosphate 2-epimerase [Heliobacteriaceae bacterium]|jgi:N-acylglucosamine-6-phosphate 2-epimerase|nr:N-acetylmannosamine-6-phosphate 2-epimerase [Heliobacteriaceae bacterium]